MEIEPVELQVVLDERHDGLPDDLGRQALWAREQALDTKVQMGFAIVGPQPCLGVHSEVEIGLPDQFPHLEALVGHEGRRMDVPGPPFAARPLIGPDVVGKVDGVVVIQDIVAGPENLGGFDPGSPDRVVETLGGEFESEIASG